MASDSRTNAGYDQINVTRKMHTFVQPGERVFVIVTSGSLSLSQSILTLLRARFRCRSRIGAGHLAYDAARIIGEQIRKVSDIDREALERDKYNFNVNSSSAAGEGRNSQPHSHLSAGQPPSGDRRSPFLQIGETKYGRPILDRGIKYDRTTLEEAAKYALLPWIRR